MMASALALNELLSPAAVATIDVPEFEALDPSEGEPQAESKIEAIPRSEQKLYPFENLKIVLMTNEKSKGRA
jgi:hypothetical protein